MYAKKLRFFRKSQICLEPQAASRKLAGGWIGGNRIGGAIARPNTISQFNSIQFNSNGLCISFVSFWHEPLQVVSVVQNQLTCDV